MCPIATCFSAETRRISGTTDREIRFGENHITEDIRYRHLGSRNQVEVIELYMIHLPFLVRELSGTIARILIDHMRYLKLLVARGGILVQEVGDQGSLQFCPFAFVYRESRSGELHPEFEVDNIIFLGQFPVRKRPFVEGRNFSCLEYIEVVIGRLSFRNNLVGDIGDTVKHLSKGGRRLIKFSIETLGKLLILSSLFFGSFGFFLFPFLHQRAYFLGELIALGERLVKLCLERTAFFIQSNSLLYKL